jgi:hypothetical protein
LAPRRDARPGGDLTASAAAARRGTSPSANGLASPGSPASTADGVPPTAPPTRDRRRTFKASGISVGDDLPLCAGAAFCDAMDGDVWSFLLRSRDPEIRDRIMRMIERCPSGRLTTRSRPRAPMMERDAEQEMEPTAAVVRDGPYWVRGGVEIVDEDGEVWEVRNRVALCRAGRSDNKPFCARLAQGGRVPRSGGRGRERRTGRIARRPTARSSRAPAHTRSSPRLSRFGS